MATSGDGLANIGLVTGNSITTQEIPLKGFDTCDSRAVYGQDVTIIPSHMVDSIKSSNMVKGTQVVAYDWPHKHYKGQLVAMDRRHKYVAYQLKGRGGGVVRIIQRELAERTLIKGYNGLVVDLAFAHTAEDILATLDEGATLYVHKIQCDSINHITTSTLLQLSWPSAAPDMRVIWCCYIPEETDSDCADDEDKSMLLSTVIESKVYAFNVEQLTNEHGVGPHQYTDVVDSIVEINRHTAKVVSATFSPDGSAIATASEDGSACFFEMDTRNRPSTRKCLYSWQPHAGQPISMLYFLDDLTNLEPSVKYWRYAITATSNNTEIKIWSCDKWQCLQTLRFSPRSEGKHPCLVGQLDLTSQYLVLSDITYRVLYVLKLAQDQSSDTVHVSSVTEFILSDPVLSLAMIGVRRKQSLNDSDDEDELYENGVEDDRGNNRGISVQVAAVQPTRIQNLEINFTPTTVSASDALQSIELMDASSAASFPPDALSDLSVSTSATDPLTTAGQITTGYSSDLKLHSRTEHFTQSPDPSTVSTDPAVIVSTPTSSTATSTDSISLSQQAAAFANRAVDDALVTDGESSTSSIASGTARSSVLLTPDSFVATTKPGILDTVMSPSAAKPAKDIFPSPGSGRSSLTHVTQIDNSSIVLGSSAFDAGTVSSISPRTLTPLSNGNGLTPRPMSAPQSAASSAAKQPSATSTEETAKQLEDLFSGLSSSVGPLGTLPTLSNTQMLTEEDLLNDSPIDSLARSLSLPNPPLSTGIHSLPPAVPIIPEPSAAVVKSTYDTNIWPKPPDPPVQKSESGETDESGTNESNDETSGTSSDVASVNDDEELNVKDIERDVEQEEANQAVKVELPVHAQAVAGKSSDETKQLLTKLGDLHTAILTINEQMMQQGRDIHLLKTSGSSDMRFDQLSKQVQSLNSTFTSKLEQTVTSLKREQRTMQDRLSTQATAKLNQELKSQMERTVGAEMKKSVLPALGQLIDPVKKDIHNVMSEKLTAADKTFKEALTKLFTSQVMVDKVGHSVGLAVQDVMLSAHRDSLQHQVLPAFDASIRQAFGQLNNAFAEGLNSYMRQLNESTDRINAKQLNSQALVATSCESVIESLTQTSKTVTKHLTTTLQKEIQQQVSQVLSTVKTDLVAEIQTTVRQELASALQGQQQVLTDQIEAIRSAAATPAPEQMNSAAIKAMIDRLLHVKEYEQAFQSALSASDLSMVMYLLSKLPESSEVLTEPCPLGQPTLLSLIQQLSSGLSQPNLDLKFDYLADAILNLDPHDTVTQQHMGRILGMVRERLTEFLAKNSSTSHRRAVLGIEKSLKSILKYVPA